MDPNDPQDPKDPSPVVIPFRKRGKDKRPASQATPQSLPDGTIVERMKKGWAFWHFDPHPLQQSTCVGCLDKRREEHAACGHADCDCFCMAGKFWPLWALFGLAPPADQPVPPQLSGLEIEASSEEDARADAQLGSKLDSANASLASVHRKLDSARRALWVVAACLAALTLVSCLVQVPSQQFLPSLLAHAVDFAEKLGMGERKPVDQPIPDEPIPGQKRAPCDPEGGEKTLNGGCYMLTDVKPPCGRKLFRSGDTCYRALGAPVPAGAR